LTNIDFKFSYILIIFCLSIIIIIAVIPVLDSPSSVQISKADGIVTATCINGTVIYRGSSDSDAILKSIATGDTLSFEKGTYNIDKKMPLKCDVSLIGRSGVIFKCLFNGTAFDTEDIAYSPWTTPLSSDVHSGNTEIELSSVNGLNAGEYVKISDDFGIYNEVRDFNYGPIASEKLYFKNGEIAKITAINGNKITINKPLYDSYSVSKNAKIRSISILEKISFENIDFVGYGMGTDSAAINIDGAYNCSISNCKFTDFGDHAVILIDCLDCIIEKNVFRRVYLDKAGYSIGLGNACDNIIIRDNSFLEKGRHYIAVGGSTEDQIIDGLCRNIYVTNNVFEDSTDEAINTHPSTRSTFRVTNNKFTNCVKGIEFSNSNSTITNNNFVDCINSIELYGTGNHLIKENDISGEKSLIGIYICDSNRGAYNIISNTILVKNYGVLLENTNSSSIEDKIIIQNNKIDASTLVSIKGYSDVIADSNIAYIANRIEGFSVVFACFGMLGVVLVLRCMYSFWFRCKKL